ncbi:pilus assembly protein [Aestuariicella hydrocarbonica]|uniref:Pilus assembly protein n=1 Tax=Pseudomaricurvus hydrocarbonicus TaxID=1470433 RepID=A0A9E5MMU1_9GAMM|nr:TadE family protein [Aestuariicella hydrocarbonica]NHO67149.1 pilus assembly protein [Aestuariicella hydrocarbonica]
MISLIHCSHPHSTLKRTERGGTLVEFSIVAAVFFMVLFGIIEFGRLMFTWNVLDEVTRRGARLAAVCPIDAIDGISDRASFHGAILNNFSNDNLLIEYFDENSAPIPDPTTDFINIRFVGAKIINYQFQGFIPFVTFILPSPDFQTVLPSESLGIAPVGAVVSGSNVDC